MGIKMENPRIHSTVRIFFLSSAFWMVLGALAGLTGAVELVAPDLLGNISWLVFGRLRQVHTNLVMFGFVGSALLGAAHFLVPKLVRAPLYSQKLGVISALLWDLAIAVGIVALSLGYTQNREYAEFIWPVDLGVLLVLALIFYNMLRTVMARQENLLYVSVWYVFGAVIFTFFSYFFGNAVWEPQTGSIVGIPDAILAWFYGHNILGFFFTPLSVAVAYYVIPITSRRPLYSHTLSLVGFWSLLLLYSHIGTHHLVQAPAPTWLKVVAITGSVGMLIPVMTVLINLWLTMQGRVGTIHEDIGGKFVFAGTVWYLMTCLQGPLQSLPYIQRVTHFTNWVVAHAHMGVLGFAGLTALGAMYFMIPRITGRPIYSQRLADVQYWFVLVGMTGFFTILTAAGLVQGHGWLNGETVYRILPQLHVYMVARAASGVLILAGALVGLYNIAMSFRMLRTEGAVPSQAKGASA
ncbi:MAG: cbb3-type cytochrome c oxidase subunit I [bacterium]